MGWHGMYRQAQAIAHVYACTCMYMEEYNTGQDMEKSYGLL